MSGVNRIIQEALNEDIMPSGDITTDSLIDKNKTSKFNLIVNEHAVLSGLELFKNTFQILDKDIQIKFKHSDGDEVSSGACVAELFGNTRAILKGERTALNFLSHLSGIATETRKLRDLIKDTKVTLLDTRKTTPNLRHYEKQAVLAGGAKNHRFNLSEMILIKDNHILNAGGVKEAILKARSVHGDKFKIEIEVSNLSELMEAIPLKPDIIMFDNWKVEDLKNALKQLPGTILSEISGQINPKNIRDYASCGVDYISTSYMIKYSKWIDFSLSAVLL